MANKEKNVITSVWVFWILIAIIGVSMLFTGFQSSIAGDSITTSVMFIVIGIILLFIGLIMVIGRANIVANDLEMPSKKEEDK